MKIGICNDHSGVEIKNKLAEYLTGKGYEIVNFGSDIPDSIDYPDVAHPLATAVESGEVDLGIALCGTGNGMAITLNKHQDIRAGLCWSVEIGELIKQHQKRLDRYECGIQSVDNRRLFAFRLCRNQGVF